MTTILFFIFTIYSYTSPIFILILLLHVMSQIFEKQSFSNIFTYYMLSGILFILIYHGPRFFRQGARMPYYYLFICFIFISVIWSSVFLKGSISAKLPYLFYFYAVYKCIVFMLSWLYSSEALFDRSIFQFLCMTASVIEFIMLYFFTRIYIRHPFRFIYHFSTFQTALMLFCPVSFFLILQLADPSISFPYLGFLTIAAICLMINLPIFYYLYVTLEEQMNHVIL